MYDEYIMQRLGSECSLTFFPPIIFSHSVSLWCFYLFCLFIFYFCRNALMGIAGTLRLSTAKVTCFFNHSSLQSFSFESYILNKISCVRHKRVRHHPRRLQRGDEVLQPLWRLPVPSPLCIGYSCPGAPQHTHRDLPPGLRAAWRQLCGWVSVFFHLGGGWRWTGGHRMSDHWGCVCKFYCWRPQIVRDRWLRLEAACWCNLCGWE